MRILLVGAKWHGNLTNYCELALTQLGHSVEIFNDLPLFQTSFNSKLLFKIDQYVPKISKQIDLSLTKKMNKLFIRKVEDTKPDMILILKGERILTDSLQVIKKKFSGPIVSWWFDSPFASNLGAYSKNVIESLSYIDYFFIFDPFYLQSLSYMKSKNIYYLPLAACLNAYQPLALSVEDRKRYEASLSFVGAYSRLREPLLNALSDLELSLWGGQWKSQKLKKYIKSSCAIPVESTSRVYNASKINLNINEIQSVQSTNARTFEVLGTQSFLLTDFRPGLSDLFVLGEEIICYKDATQLRSLVDYYLKHSNEAEEIAKKGYQRVLKDHTYVHRMKQMLCFVR